MRYDTLRLMSLLTLGLPASAHAQPPHAAPAHSARHARITPTAPAAMPIDLWTPLDAPASAIAPAGSGRRLDTSVPVDGSEQITVFSKRHNYDQEWRDELRASAPVYEAGSSDAGRPLYAAGPVWDSPQEQHTMSDAKAAMGLCGGLGGLITCPNQ